MERSLTYYLTILVLKLKGIKKTFQTDPIDYKTLRKGDVLKPNSRFIKKYLSAEFRVSDCTISEIKYSVGSKSLLLFVHGGAFVSGPSKHHWDTIEKLAKHTPHTIWLCNYPKAPEYNITTITKNIAAVYDLAQLHFATDKIYIIGDSVGGNLILSLVQQLIRNKKKLPHQLILVSPVVDSTLSNPMIDDIEKKDPMLSKVGVLSSKQLCAGEINLRDSIISPLYGEFLDFPKTALFLAEHDITYPDQLLLLKKLQNAKVETEVIVGKGMPHIWPFLPVMKEAKLALKKIIELLNEN